MHPPTPYTFFVLLRRRKIEIDSNSFFLSYNGKHLMYTEDVSNILLSHATQNSTRPGYIYLGDKISWSHTFCLIMLSPLSYNISPDFTLLADQFERVACPSTHCTWTVILDSHRRVAQGSSPGSQDYAGSLRGHLAQPDQLELCARYNTAAASI